MHGHFCKTISVNQDAETSLAAEDNSLSDRVNGRKVH